MFRLDRGLWRIVPASSWSVGRWTQWLSSQSSRVRPASRAYFLISTQSIFREMAVPRSLRKSWLPVRGFTKWLRPDAR